MMLTSRGAAEAPGTIGGVGVAAAESQADEGDREHQAGRGGTHGRHAAREHDEGHGAKSMTRRTGRASTRLDTLMGALHSAADSDPARG